MGNDPMPNGQRPYAKRATKEEPINKNHEEELSPPLVPPQHKPIDDGFLAEMTAAFPELDVKDELERFRDYYRSRGKRLKDWRAGFRNWLKKAREFRDKRGSPPRAGPRQAVAGQADLDEWDQYKAGQR